MKEKSKFLKGLAATLSVIMVLFTTYVPVKAGDPGINSVSNLVTAYNNASDGDTITLSDNISGDVAIEVSSDKTVTIDGAGYTITGDNATDTDACALTISGTGNVNIVNLTVQGGDVSGSGDSIGIKANSNVSINAEAESASDTELIANGGTCDVAGATASYGVIYEGAGNGSFIIENANGGVARISYGAFNLSSGTLTAYNATGAISSGYEVSNSYGAYNFYEGSLYVEGTATGGNSQYSSFGAVCTAGNMSVREAKGGRVEAQVSGPNVVSCGASCIDGTMKVDTATGGISNGNGLVGSVSYGILCRNGVLDVNTATGGDSDNTSIGASLSGNGTISLKK